jgi:hypothetical protein
MRCLILIPAYRRDDRPKMSDVATDNKASANGVRITRGVAVAFPPGGLVIHGDSGRLEVREIHLRFNLATEWLEIALENLERARLAHQDFVTRYAEGDNSDEPLNREFKAAMQAMVAAGTFFEALYSATREVLPANRLTHEFGGRSKGKRAALVAEQLKKGFGLRTKGAANLASVVSEIYRYRDESVHPSASFGPPVVHPVLNQFVERRVAMFTFPNAQLLVRASLAYAKILPTIAIKQGPKEIQELANYLLSTSERMFQQWEQQYGDLLDKPAP